MLQLFADAGPVRQSLSILAPASPSGASIRDLSYLVAAITGVIFLLVEGVLIYSLTKGRRRLGKQDAEPPQVYGSKPIEIAWTAAPTLVVFVLVLIVARTLWEVRSEPERGVPGAKRLSVTVIGHQWWWEYRYEKYGDRALGFTTANELHLPVSLNDSPRVVDLALQSADVCHSYWLPKLGGKTDLLPGRSNAMWLQTGEPGLYLGQCAEYCGTQHAKMLLRAEAEPEAEFEKWLEAEAKPAIESPSKGRDKFLSLSCVNCHTIRGTSAKGVFGPDLTHVMSRKTLASGILENTNDNLRRWVADPQSIKPGCLMPAFALTDADLNLVVKYLATLK